MVHHAVPDDVVTNSDTLKLLSKAVTDGVGKPEQVVKDTPKNCEVAEHTFSVCRSGNSKTSDKRIS